MENELVVHVELLDVFKGHLREVAPFDYLLDGVVAVFTLEPYDDGQSEALLSVLDVPVEEYD